ncbi:DUF2779 domain-containing protein [Tenacibaculum mesophilum]|uniref:DUF2779 domain-containing protein n=1 Tax=Tenacibaculum mesophilum TaxID=104268 RepID=UPI003F616581
MKKIFFLKKLAFGYRQVVKFFFIFTKIFIEKLQLTKTDFIQYLNYPESLWGLKNKPNKHPKGELTHFEWLGSKLEQSVEMLEKMQGFTGSTGTFISWNAPFEVSRNKDMIVWIPKFKDYLKYMNTHMFDLMNIFKTDYVDYRFHGSTSIKKYYLYYVLNFHIQI